ncbi:MAG: YbdD/YjiX family protein [Escherichia coli]|nr:YbdD/YjiX family protein [Escherichia coli]
MFDSLAKAGKYLGQAAKLMIGMPDYDNYVEHMRVNHPDQTPMTYEEFFREAKFARQALNDSTFSNAARNVSGVSVTGR